MNLKQLRMLGVLAVLSLAVLSVSTMAANQDTMKAGKKATITLTTPAQVGEVTLQAGQYVFQHVVSAGQHFATFKGPRGATSTTQKVKCTNEPLKQRVAQTSVTIDNAAGASKITRIEIAGEDVAHVF
jgi:hypothetical protein